jgi:hypothetical protein
MSWEILLGINGVRVQHLDSNIETLSASKAPWPFVASLLQGIGRVLEFKIHFVELTKGSQGLT